MRLHQAAQAEEASDAPNCLVGLVLARSLGKNGLLGRAALLFYPSVAGGDVGLGVPLCLLLPFAFFLGLPNCD